MSINKIATLAFGVLLSSAAHADENSAVECAKKLDSSPFSTELEEHIKTAATITFPAATLYDGSSLPAATEHLRTNGSDILIRRFGYYVEVVVTGCADATCKAGIYTFSSVCGEGPADLLIVKED